MNFCLHKLLSSLQDLFQPSLYLYAKPFMPYFLFFVNSTQSDYFFRIWTFWVNNTIPHHRQHYYFLDTDDFFGTHFYIRLPQDCMKHSRQIVYAKFTIFTRFSHLSYFFNDNTSFSFTITFFIYNYLFIFKRTTIF